MLVAFSYANDPSKGSCDFSQDGAFKVGFIAYKTSAKKGVGAVFDNVKYAPIAKSGENFKEMLVGSSVVIDTNSVNSNNKGRDVKLVKFFFKQMKESTIKAKIIDSKAIKVTRGDPKKGTLLTEITMNGVTNKVPMSYVLNKGKLSATGVIDLFDFSASLALKSINQACYALHQGKTWNDVSISFETNIKAVCYPSAKK